jgi:hypothetical protein
MKTKKKKLIIKESRWMHNDKKDISNYRASLYNPTTRKMCCLGFYCRQIHGKQVSQIIDKAWPSSVGINDLLYERQSNLTYANDRPGITLSQRKKEIKELFAEADIEVEFVK